MPKPIKKEVTEMAESENLSSFAKKLVEAVSYLAIAGLGWSVAVWIVDMIVTVGPIPVV